MHHSHALLHSSQRKATNDDHTLTSNERFPAENILEGRRKLMRESTRKCGDGKRLHTRHSETVTAVGSAAECNNQSVMQVCTCIISVSCSTYPSRVRSAALRHTLSSQRPRYTNRTQSTHRWYDASFS